MGDTDQNARAAHQDKRYQQRKEEQQTDFRASLVDKTVPELQKMADERGVKRRSEKDKDELIDAIAEQENSEEGDQ